MILVFLRNGRELNFNRCATHLPPSKALTRIQTVSGRVDLYPMGRHGCACRVCTSMSDGIPRPAQELLFARHSVHRQRPH